MGRVIDCAARVAALVLALVVLVLAGGGVAGAQDRPSVPPPSSPPALNVPGTAPNQGNDFQKAYADCMSGQGSDSLIPSGTDMLGMIFPQFKPLTDSPNNVTCTSEAMTTAPVDGVATGIENTSSAFWGDPVGKFTKAVMEGNVAAFTTVMTFWMSVPIPGLATGDAITGIRNITWEVQLVFFALGMVIAAAKLAIARQQAVAEGADETAKMLVRTVFAAGLLPVLVIIGHLAGDVFSSWVMQLAAGGDVNAKINGIAWIDEKTGLGPVLALVLTGLGLLGSVMQLIALLVREAVLSIIVGLAPIAAAASATGTGRQSWSTMMGFVVAALLFKPIASLFYAFAFWSASSTDATAAVIGSVLLAVAGLSLPSLMASIGPVAAGGGGGGSQAAMMAGATGAMKASAANLGKSGYAGGSGGAAASGKPGGGPSGGPAATGSTTPSYGGRYSGSSQSGAPGAAPSGGRSAARTSAGVMGAAGSGVRVAASGAGTLGRGLAVAGQVVGQGAAAAANIADGAVGNYHGQIPR